MCVHWILPFLVPLAHPETDSLRKLSFSEKQQAMMGKAAVDALQITGAYTFS